jgi:glutathione peroxidase
MSDLFSFDVQTIRNEPTTLADWRGQVLLIVNTASKCGLTPQYAGLEALHARFKDRGFSVLGFPANDFAGQEPGTNDEIAAFCETSFGVSFPLFGKVAVTGAARHPLYSALTTAAPEATSVSGEDFRAKLKGYGITPTNAPEVLWNFEKFLVGRDGKIIARFAPDTAPDAPAVIAAIEAAL